MQLVGQELLIRWEHPSCFLVFSGVYIAQSLVFCVVFVGGLMSSLRYLCLLAVSGVQHILCFVFALFFFVLCTLCCQFLWIVHCWLPLLYSLAFIYTSDFNGLRWWIPIIYIVSDLQRGCSFHINVIMSLSMFALVPFRVRSKYKLCNWYVLLLS